MIVTLNVPSSLSLYSISLKYLQIRTQNNEEFQVGIQDPFHSFHEWSRISIFPVSSREPDVYQVDYSSQIL